MRKHPLVLSLSVVGLAVLSVLAGWGLRPGTHLDEGWRTLGAVWIYLAAAAAITAAFAALFMWLAVYSANDGYDDPAQTKGR
ncbi:hypothetical protein [Phenylobacterium sp.]|jgi:vacuolar-type H+-ATPase subunit I/STV1|uniref:hypothetical protein n=1 Tax=Phenylobacterium sp. TaxID=1871053 RepID=UPI002F400A4F